MPNLLACYSGEVNYGRKMAYSKDPSDRCYKTFTVALNIVVLQVCDFRYHPQSNICEQGFGFHLGSTQPSSLTLG